MVHGVVILKCVHKLFHMSAIKRWSPPPLSEYGPVVVTHFPYGVKSKPGEASS